MHRSPISPRSGTVPFPFTWYVPCWTTAVVPQRIVIFENATHRENDVGLPRRPLPSPASRRTGRAALGCRLDCSSPTTCFASGSRTRSSMPRGWSTATYSGVRDLTWERADVLVWLDYGLPVVLARLVRRSVWRVATRAVLWNGNRETLLGQFVSRDGLVRCVVANYTRKRREYGRLLHAPAVHGACGFWRYGVSSRYRTAQCVSLGSVTQRLEGAMIPFLPKRPRISGFACGAAIRRS